MLLRDGRIHGESYVGVVAVSRVTFTILFASLLWGVVSFAEKSTSQVAETAGDGEALKWVQHPELNYDKQSKQWVVTFEIDSATDVEVAIVDPDKSQVVRHLAAGVLGPKAPPPLIVNSRSQKMV